MCILFCDGSEVGAGGSSSYKMCEDHVHNDSNVGVNNTIIDDKLFDNIEIGTFLNI